MDIKMLSRKFILSVSMMVLSTMLLLNGNVSENYFGIVLMATVVSYIVGKTTEKKFGNVKTNSVKLWDRLKSLFSREFALSMITVFGLSWLTWNGIVSQDLWFQVVTAIGGAYNIFNSIEKVGK